MSLEVLFLFCAVVGGTVLVCQFLLSLLGIGADVGDIEADVHPDSSWLFGAISLRALVAAMAFFGLAGMAARSAGLQVGGQLLVASVSGVMAMYAMHWAMLALGRLNQDGTLRIQRSLGKPAVVYLPIPGSHGGAGKVHIHLQGRTVEYRAVTGAAARLPSGTRVVVVHVHGADTLEVEPAVPVPETDPLDSDRQQQKTES